MKNLKYILMLLVSFLIIGDFLTYAQVASNSIGAPDSIDNAISFVLGIASGIPAIGSYLVVALKILGIASAVLTALSAVLMALAKGFNLAGVSSVENFITKILPYVQYASMFNVQKSS